MTSLSLTSQQRWRPSPFIMASVAFHVAALATVLLHSDWWPWALTALVMNHLVIAACGLIPRCGWLGNNIRRLPASAAARGQWALTLDDGPDPLVTPQVLDLLDAHTTKATFFVIAERARQHPALIADMVARGHSVQNHTHVHSHGFAFWGARRIARELRQAQQTLAQLTGNEPRYFRAPAGLRNPFLEPVLARLGLQLVSWTRRGYDTRVNNAQAVISRLLPALNQGAILLLHDGNASRDPRGQWVVLQVLAILLDTAKQRGLHAVTLPQGMRA